MIVGFVEPSGEAPALAVAEVGGACEALGGRVESTAAPTFPRLIPVSLPEVAALVALADRLALARRVLVRVGEADAPEAAARAEGRGGVPAAFRRLGAPGGEADAGVRAVGHAYVNGGGRIDLSTPRVRYWVADEGAQGRALLREVAAVDRTAAASRAMPRLPFRRPVSLPPRFARAAVNLAAVRAGDRVLDPFLGTGALLGESALLGARVYGVDADPAMVRGALRNLAHLGVDAEALSEGDARTVEVDAGPFEALVTDPPYGRASATVGAAPTEVLRAVLARWAPRLVPDGRVVVVTPGGPACLPSPWVEEHRIPVRVHRSLTREFRRYRRGGVDLGEHRGREVERG